jgi:hypothetical protein
MAFPLAWIGLASLMLARPAGYPIRSLFSHEGFGHETSK